MSSKYVLCSFILGGDGDGDKVTEACSGGVVLLNEESGIFTSMHYGEQEYPLSTVCKWKIQVPKDKVRKLMKINSKRSSLSLS